MKLMKISAAAAASLIAFSAQAELAGTIGAVSDYHFRGMNLGGAGGYGAIDYTQGGFYAGVWAIDDGSEGNNGLETDFYLGWGGESEGFSYGIGYTRYEYTLNSDFEHEINLSASYANVSLDIAIGQDDDDATDDADYTVIELGYSHNQWGVKVGRYDLDERRTSPATTDPEAEYNWFELSYSTEIASASVTATYGRVFGQEADGNDVTSRGSDYLVFDISKSFDLNI